MNKHKAIEILKSMLEIDEPFDINRSMECAIDEAIHALEVLEIFEGIQYHISGLNWMAHIRKTNIKIRTDGSSLVKNIEAGVNALERISLLNEDLIQVSSKWGKEHATLGEEAHESEWEKAEKEATYTFLAGSEYMARIVKNKLEENKNKTISKEEILKLIS